MAESQGFSHITVTPDDDDVVIQAGIVDDADDAETAFEAAGEAEEAATAEAIEGAPAVEGEPERAAGAADPEPTSSAPARPAKAPAGVADDGYRETTLADLESSKMSSAQKVVIVVAILGIIAFAAWYLFAR